MNKEIHHDSAELHVTGKSVYVNDIDAGEGMLLGKVLFSKHAHAKITTVDWIKR